MINENVTATIIIIIIPLPTHHHYFIHHIATHYHPIAQPLSIIIIIFPLPQFHLRGLFPLTTFLFVTLNKTKKVNLSSKYAELFFFIPSFRAVVWKKHT